MPTTTLLSLALVVSFLAVLPERWWMRAGPVAVFIGMLLVAGLSTTIRGPIVLVALLAWGGLLHSKILRWGWAIANTLILGGTVAATHRLVFETHACQAESLPAARTSEGLDGEIPGPPSPVLHLVDLPTEIDGPTPSVPAAAALVATRHGEAWRATASGQSGTLQLRVTPGGADAVRVWPSADPAFPEGRRLIQEQRIALERSLAPDSPVLLTLDVDEVMRGNWEGDESTLAAIQVRFDGGEGRLESLHLAPSDQSLRSAPAGTAIADVGGVLRPSFFLNDGASVRARVEVPSDGALRLHIAAQGEASLSISIGERSLLPSTRAPDRWQAIQLPLSDWAGQSVDIDLRSHGPGIALVGDPRVLTGSSTAPQNVIVYLVDTLRADHIGFMGSNLPTTAMNRLHREGAVMALTNSTSSWTKPAIPSLMSGIWPTTHRVGAHTLGDRMPSTVPLVQERFRDAGWRTGSFSASPLGSTLSGLERGFGTALPPRFWGIKRSTNETPTADQLHRALFDWWAEEEGPIFAYVQTLDVHQFYKRDGGDECDECDARLYADSVVDADALFQDFLDELEALGHAEDTLVVFTSDHGESFMDHDIEGHGTGLFQSQVHIPLVFWAPSLIAPSTYIQPVSLVDIAPTLLDLFGLPPLDEADGRSLKPILLERMEGAINDSVHSALLRFTWTHNAPLQFATLSADGRKAVRIGDREFSFQIRDDLCERRARGAGPFATLDAWVEAQISEAARFDAAHVRDQGGVGSDELEMLELLGYVE